MKFGASEGLATDCDQMFAGPEKQRAIGNRRRGLDSATAYRRISLEEEAFAAEGEESV